MREAARMQFPQNRPDAIQITAINGRTLLRLKSWLPEYMDGSRPMMLAGQELPAQVNTTVSGPLRSLCVGPGEWLILPDEHTASNLREQFASEPSKHGFALVDVSEGLTAMEVQGPFAREVLSKGCGLDMYPRSFPAGRCARTRFAQIPLIIEHLRDPSRFDLFVSRSHSNYLHSWLTDAAIEFQSTPT